MRFIPKSTKVRLKFYKNITLIDIIIGVCLLSIIAMIAASNLPYKYVLALGVVCLSVPLFLPIGEERIYLTAWYMVKHLFSVKAFNRGGKHDTADLFPYERLKENYIELKNGTFMAVLEIHPLEFRLLSGAKQDYIIDGAMTAVYNSLGVGQEASIIKLEKPLNLDGQLESEVKRMKNLVENYESGNLSETEYMARMNIIEDRAFTIDEMNGSSANHYGSYYFALYDRDEKSLLNSISYIRQLFCSAGAEARLLKMAGLYEFVRLSVGRQIAVDEYDSNSQETEEQNQYALSSLIPKRIEFNLLRTRQDDKILSHFIITGYPLNVGNAWGAGLFDLPYTKVTLSLKPVEKSKAARRIDNAIMELSARAGNKASEVIDKSTHIETLSALLNSLQNDNETMLDTTLLITAYDEPNKNTVKRTVKRKLRELGFNFSETIGRQSDAYLANGFYDKLNYSRGIQSSSVAACFPFVSNAVVDEDGLLIGENDLPVFADFWKRDTERVNSNMVIVGKPGSGKSYAAKTMLCNLASTGAKIFVLDPESEYSKVTDSLGGKVLDAASSKYGIINPFQIIAGMKEDDADTETGNDFFAHLRFLEQFFKVAFAGLNSDCLELLNKATLDCYRIKGITGKSNPETLTGESYPTFDNLAAVVDEQAEKETDAYTLSCIKTIQNYLSKFKSGGRNSALWNGVSSFNLSENFVCFNFQKLLADKNETVANAQMLLILKWLENEVIKNREYNMRHCTSRKIVVVIDEAHLFVNEQYPVALDFMFQLAKRIRKYDGMQIVITQNIKDFAGTPEIARKSTAIINVSQYSLIFSLSPSDMTDICKLYEKAGEINESEQASIAYNPRGRMFFIYGAANRTNVSIKATPYVESLFM
ncbi:MAG: DUF87 domain-containing protein [Firmicutes bacterium]|nr:DUF87 domain-containing protein [Bacillota bacterium]